MFKDKDEIKTRYMSMIVCGFLPWAACIFAMALVLMTIDRGRWMEEKKKQVKVNLPIKPQRGNILSDKGELLVSSLPQYTPFIEFVYIDRINKKTEKKVNEIRDSIWKADIDTLCRELNQFCPIWSVQKYKKHLLEGKAKKSRYHKFLPRKVSYAQYKELKKFHILRHKVAWSGLGSGMDTIRKKPFGSLAEHTLGRLNTQTDSAYRGLELKYDSILRGRPGIKHITKINQRNIDIIDVPAINGSDIQTTLNVEMQDICETALLNELIKVNGISGRVILMEVETGDIKSIVNLTKTGEGRYKEMESFVYERSNPGSIFKPIALAAALEDKLITPYDSVPHHNKSHVFYGGKRISDTGSYSNGTDKYSVIEVMEQSSNIGMGEIINRGYKKNPQKFIDRLKEMGVDDKYDILLGSRKPYLKTPKEKNWSLMDLVSMSYGYVVETTPLNMVTFYNTIANDGKQMKPRIVKAIIKDGEVVHEFEPEVLREQALSEQTVKDLKMILFEVVNDKNGTGKKVKTDKFQVAGKTGTARRVKPGYGYNYSPMEYLLSFCGYFPADKPQYTCIVQIIKAGPGSGGGMSGLVFKDIAERVMAKSLRLPLQAATDTLNGHTPAAKHGNLTAASYLLDKLDIETDNDLKSNGEYTWGKIRKEGEKLTYEPRNIKEGIVPDVRGMGAKDAIYLLKKAGLNARLSGYGKVTQQTIPPGHKVSKGSHIHITLTP